MCIKDTSANTLFFFIFYTTATALNTWYYDVLIFLDGTFEGSKQQDFKVPFAVTVASLQHTWSANVIYIHVSFQQWQFIRSILTSTYICYLVTIVFQLIIVNLLCYQPQCSNEAYPSFVFIGSVSLTRDIGNGIWVKYYECSYTTKISK